MSSFFLTIHEGTDLTPKLDYQIPKQISTPKPTIYNSTTYFQKIIHKFNDFKIRNHTCMSSTTDNESYSGGIFLFIAFHVIAVKTSFPLMKRANQSPITQPLLICTAPPLRPTDRHILIFSANETVERPITQ